MATSNNTIKTRIQLKSDIEANWRLASDFIPKRGELIIYSADGTHSYSRLKVGDGSTRVNDLPFIDAGTLNGEETVIIKRPSRSAFPSPGLSTHLYIDTSTNKIYHYEASSGYTELAHFTFTTETIGSVAGFSRGLMTTATIENNTVKIINGFAPDLTWGQRTVVTDIQFNEEAGT